MKKGYYALTTRVEAGWNLPCHLKLTKTGVTGQLGPILAHPVAWKEPPHVVFANLAYGRTVTPSDVRNFIAKYGGVGAVREPREPLEAFEVSTRVFSYTQELFRAIWREGRASDVFFSRGAEGEEHYSLRLLRDPQGFSLYPANCLTYLQFLLARDLDEKNARVCKNKTCPAPYFVAERRKKIFCTRKCANTSTVRDWRKINT